MFYGYTHFFIFAAAGAFSAGIEVEIDVLTGRQRAARPVVLLRVHHSPRCLPARRVGGGHQVQRGQGRRDGPSLARLLVLIDPLLPVPFGLIAVVLVLTVAVLVRRQPVDRPMPMHRPVNA
ncbi:hypothetical protein [uncultured Kocuria sp.]|uniref:hypothetical protein n=1 Tax=uncultured Kocuria sp. TaxID=259305 RepID=UPI0026004D71|nr:hypothetical protein [uncultured Kocuria sp.]